jgi:hypothetical protein
MGFNKALVLACAILTASSCAEPVQVYVGDLVHMRNPLAGYNISVLETGEIFTTDSNGELNLQYAQGTMLTFLFLRAGEYAEIQSGTVVVPAGGLATEQTQVVLQVPSTVVLEVLEAITNGRKDPRKCQVVVTVCNRNRTFDSFPQGIPGAMATLQPPNSTHTYYFGTWGALSNYTNPLPNDLTSTTWDGGVLFDNVEPAADVVYTVSATLPGYVFSSSLIKCPIAGRVINAAPNQGPRVV